MTQLLTQKKQALSYADRVTIASVLTWDSIGKVFNPDDIEAIQIKEDMAWIKLTDGAYPISRYMFRSILEAQRASINKQIEKIVNAEAQEVIEAEREMSEIIHATATQESCFELLKDDWLTEPIGANPDAIFGLFIANPDAICGRFIEPSNEEIATFTVAENGYDDQNWTSEGCEF